MTPIEARITSEVTVGDGHPLAVIAGPCVIESYDGTVEIAGAISEICSSAGVPLIFKSSFDKANRTSVEAFRGIGMDKGLETLNFVGTEMGIPTTTDVHEVGQVEEVAKVVDLIQVPALLSRQTDLLLAAASTGRCVNVKKGQFLSPADMRHVVDKVRAAGATHLAVTERGTSFGYNDVIVDFRSLARLRNLGCPVILDASHGAQQPGALGSRSGGDRDLIGVLARAGVAAGVDAIFVEVHAEPDRALSDGPTSLALQNLKPLLEDLLLVREAWNSRQLD